MFHCSLAALKQLKCLSCWCILFRPQGFAVPGELSIAKKMEPMKMPSRVDANCVLCILSDLQVAVSTAGGVVWIVEPKAGSAAVMGGVVGDRM